MRRSRVRLLLWAILSRIRDKSFFTPFLFPDPVITNNSGNSRLSKMPIEIALEVDMIAIIPYLLMKGANAYIMKQVNFFYEGEEDLNYLSVWGCESERQICVKSKRAFYTDPLQMRRTFIGELIAKNRLDVIEILHKMGKADWIRVCCCVMGVDYTPLQFALAIKRYEIAQFLIDHGAKIE